MLPLWYQNKHEIIYIKAWVQKSHNFNIFIYKFLSTLIKQIIKVLFKILVAKHILKTPPTPPPSTVRKELNSSGDFGIPTVLYFLSNI